MITGTPVLDFLRSNPVFTLFIVLGCGYLLGRIRLGPIALGPVAGALLVSLLFGQYGFKITPGAQSVGFALFIFAVGYQAGPRFFEVLRTQGLQYLLLALFVGGVGVAAAVVAGKLLALPFGGTAGLLAGAMTTTPTLAAAQEAVRSGIVSLPEGVTADGALASIASSYAITYVVGLIGIIATVRLLPRLVGVDLAAEAAEMEEAGKTGRGSQMQARAYRVDNPEVCALTIRELRARMWDALAVVRLRRDGEWVLQPDDDERLRPGDEIHAYGDSQFFLGGIESLGEEIPVSCRDRTGGHLYAMWSWRAATPSARPWPNSIWRVDMASSSLRFAAMGSRCRLAASCVCSAAMSSALLGPRPPWRNCATSSVRWNPTSSRPIWRPSPSVSLSASSLVCLRSTWAVYRSGSAWPAACWPRGYSWAGLTPPGLRSASSPSRRAGY